MKNTHLAATPEMRAGERKTAPVRDDQGVSPSVPARSRPRWAVGLLILLFSDAGKVTDSQVLLVEQALKAAWQNGWLAHAQMASRRRP
jgi:hypothetical protein